MACTRSSAHVVPMDAIVDAAPEKAGILARVHREEYCVIRPSERARNRLSCEVAGRRIQQRQAHGPARAIVGRNCHFEWQPFRYSTASTEKSQGLSIAPNQSGLTVERFEIAEQLWRIPILRAVAQSGLNESSPNLRFAC